MSKYVEVKALEKAIIENAQDLRTLSTKTVGKAISSLPTIDIVHCEDCRNATYTVKNSLTHETFYACPYSCIQHEGKFFCAYGERKDNE